MCRIAQVIKRIIIPVAANLRRWINYLKSRYYILLSIQKGKSLLMHGKGLPDGIQSLDTFRLDFGTMPQVNVFTSPEPTLDLSIIIPLYNSAEYVEECLDSVLNQKTKFNYEVILVNDGSTDNTMETIDTCLKDPRIKLIEQENHGQAYARNRAIEQSSGKYIMMVDSDDIITDDCVELLLNTAIKTNSDIAEGCVHRFGKTFDVPYTRNQSIRVYEYSRNPSFVLQTVGYSVAKVYRKELWKTLRYPEGYIFEDVITKFILRRKAKRVAVIDNFIYGYRHDTNSSSHKLEGLKHLDSIWVYPRIVSLCKNEEVPFDDVFYLLSLNHITILNYITTLHISPEIRISCFAEMKNQLESIQFCRPKKLPYLFYLLEQSILKGNIDAWQEIAGTVTKYKLLKKWRELN